MGNNNIGNKIDRSTIINRTHIRFFDPAIHVFSMSLYFKSGNRFTADSIQFIFRLVHRSVADYRSDLEEIRFLNNDANFIRIPGKFAG